MTTIIKGFSKIKPKFTLYKNEQNMDWISIILGILATGFGIYTLNARRKENYNSARLHAMQSMFGEKGGSKVHLIIYGVVPIILGAMMFFKAFGVTL